MSEPAVETERRPFRATEEEYLRYEYDAEFKHEWRDGVVTAMAGGSPDQALISANIILAAGRRLPEGCRAYTSDLRVKSRRRSLYYYPDITIICGPREFEPKDERKQTITNPKIIIEILSPSTESDDRGNKFERYRAIDSFEEYVLVTQGRPKVETFHKTHDGIWIINHAVADLGQSVLLRSVGIELPLAEIYAGVQLESSDGSEVELDDD